MKRLWVVRQGRPVQYERLGECNGCGQCCRRFNYRFEASSGPTAALYRGEDLSEYEGWAAEDWHTDGLTIQWWSPLGRFDREEPCRSFDEETGKCRSFGKPARPQICEVFPLRPEDLEGLECTYEFREIVELSAPDGTSGTSGGEPARARTLTIERPDRPMNVLLLTIDALRRDRCLKVMHRFQHWAQEHAVFFANHYTVAHCSDPNYLSMLSGIHPDDHGVLTQIVQMKEEEAWPGYPAFPSIAAWLKKFYGHRCGGWTATYPRFYYYGFDEVSPMGRDVKTLPGWVGLKDFTERAVKDGLPWYFFVRTMDCHGPYKHWDHKKAEHRGGSYNKAVKWTDELVGDLLEYVMEEHPNTLIVFCSDHGELLGEHGMKEHFSTLYQELIHPPMYIYWPGCPGGLVCEEFTQHIDVFPTIVDLFGVGKEALVAILAGMDGLPMTWAMQGQRLRERMSFVGEGVYAEAYQQHRALIEWPWKYIATAHIADGPKFELFNLEEDPAEKRNLAAEMPERTQAMAEMVAASHWRATKFVRPDTAEQWEHQYREVLGLTKEEAVVVVDRLRALGYAD